MVTSLDITFWMLCLSALSILFLFVYILRMPNKEQIHRVFLFLVLFIFLWSLGHILEVLTSVFRGYTAFSFVYLYYFGLIFVPVTLLLTGLVFVYTRLRFSWKLGLLLVFPVVDFIMLLTEQWHGLYFIEYSIFSSEVIYGPFFTLHTVVAYGYIVAGLFLLLRFSIKNAGFFSRQSLLLTAGVILPFVTNIFQTLGTIDVPVYLTPITFTVTIFLFAFAILRLGFLNVAPIALQRIVDLISDSFLIINQNYEIIDYNQTFQEQFGSLHRVKRREDLLDAIRQIGSLSVDADHLVELNRQAIGTRETQTVERNIQADLPDGGRFDKHFSIEITPVYNREDYLGTILLFKDITQSKRDMETIQANQAVIMEQERMASLGQLIGGIAHNLKTPIMSLSGGIEALRDLVAECRDSVDSPAVEREDFREIAEEMDKWLGKMKPHCSYMSDIISTVKGQATQFTARSTVSFSLGELLKRVDLLMKHELKRSHCRLEVENQIPADTPVQGEVSSLIQVLDNLIMNAIQAYRGQRGVVWLGIRQTPEGFLFSVRDQGEGIPPSVQARLFRSMVTTKGKEGTGLGLYMSHATVKGRYGGRLWFETEPGEGSTFYVEIPQKPAPAAADEADGGEPVRTGDARLP